MLNKNSHQRNTENKGSDSLDIRKKTNSLKKRYGTNDPFDIAKYLGIKVIAELEQGGDKPLFYAVLGVCVDVSVFKGGSKLAIGESDCLTADCDGVLFVG